MAEDDFINWFKLHMSVSTGPRSKQDGKQTCIAALVMQDKPGFRGVTTKHFSSVSLQDRLKPRGGLYWIDLQGNILQHDASLIGDQISHCLCDDTIIGVHRQDEQWPLWSWYLGKDNQRRIHSYLSPQVQRATMVAMQGALGIDPPFVWCIEEYERGIRVVQRECKQLQELQAVCCEGLQIPDSLFSLSPYLTDKKFQGVATYQDTLLLLIINQENQLQLLQFK